MNDDFPDPLGPRILQENGCFKLGPTTFSELIGTFTEKLMRFASNVY